MIGYILIGLVVGQLIAWCADRLPAGRPLWSLGLCHEEGTPLPASLRGSRRWLAEAGWLRCAEGGVRLRVRTPFVILATAAGFGLLRAKSGPSWDAAFQSIYWAVFLLIATTDMEHRLIPNVIVLPACAFALLGAFFTSPTGLAGLLNAVLGGAAGFLLVYVIYLFGALFARAMARRQGRPIDEVAFGAGDVKLALFIGLVTGFPEVIFALLIGILLGGVAASLYLAWMLLIRRRYVAFMAIPYGPFLIFGAVVMMLFGPAILAWYTAPYIS